jgi:2-dehydropantoate 2-reductase
MRVGVVGLGAVGGLIAARLAAAGHEVSALTRGATLAAVRARGLRMMAGGQETSATIHAADDALALGPQELVVVAVKGQALADASASMQPLLGPQTILVPAMNGVPWWFLQSLPVSVALADRRLASVDSDGRVAAALPLASVLGCVVHLTCSSPEPGLIQHGFGDRLIVGEPAGGASARATRVRDVLAGAGFSAEVSTDIRYDIWYKLWGNMTMNPVSALTGAPSDRILDDPLVHAFMLRTMEEAQRIGAQIGCPINESGQERMAVARRLGSFKTSMLQDALAGRALELDALVGAVREIGIRFGLPTPNIDALLGLTRLLARERGLYPPAA